MSSLLVVGNGFDLKLGAKTSYKNFFESTFYSETRKKIEKWIAHFNTYVQTPNDFTINMLEFDFTCWDLLFYLSSTEGPLNRSEDSIKWCDIETVIHDSLFRGIKDEIFDFSWTHVNNLLFEDLPADPSDYYEQMMASFICNRYEKGINLYEVLLEELTRFEKTFGKYIKDATGSIDYQDDANDLVESLCGTTQDIYVDTFNYSSFSFRTVTGSWSTEDVTNHFRGNRTTRHINGNCSNPIFGIDLTEEEKRKHAECIRFTKTSRRLQQDSHNLNQKVKDWPKSIDHAVVFGHSLNKMDYDYFTYLFTMLHFNGFELDKMGSVEFVYYIYDSQKADKIQRGYSDQIYNLIDFYEGNINGTGQKVLANLLRFSGKLKIRELK